MRAYNARKRQSVLKGKFIKGAVRLVRGDLGGSLKRKGLYIKISRKYMLFFNKWNKVHNKKR